MTHYEHRQTGTLLVCALGGGALACLASAFLFREQPWIPLWVGTVLLAGAALFSSLRIVITDTELCWAFGPGILKKRVALEEIQHAEETTTRFVEGWGIHLTRRGWLYNVSGFGAVAIRLKSGKRFVLGSDEPRQLAAVLRARSLAIVHQSSANLMDRDNPSP